ncbi:MAG: MMPL family transporter [bacterium]
MTVQKMRWFVTRRPLPVIGFWLVLTAILVAISPDLTRLAAEGQANLLPNLSESSVAAALVRETWPDQSYQCTLVLGLQRVAGLTEKDKQFSKKVGEAIEKAADRPKEVLRVMGPDSRPEISTRLLSADGTTQLLVFPLDTSFVEPRTNDLITWVQRTINSVAGRPPAGLEPLWTGDALIGREYMNDVQRSLDRAAIITVGLLLIVLLAVYRSFLLAMIPLLSIGVGLAVSRSALAWMTVSGWEISPLVELFLVVILFGSGTDFCLLLSWRYGEHFNPDAPERSMRVALRRALEPLVTSAGTVIVGLLLMGTTEFKLFSSTGPSVGLGLAITLLVSLTLTPALIVTLARKKPQCFDGISEPSGPFWLNMARVVLTRPSSILGVTLFVMILPILVGFRVDFVMDILSEMPSSNLPGRNLKTIAKVYGEGVVAPITMVVQADRDLRDEDGLELIDDLSRFITHQRKIGELRSATQPLGSTGPLNQARLSSRLGQIHDGLVRLNSGATELEKGLVEGGAKIRLARAIERNAGLNLLGNLGMKPKAGPAAPKNNLPPASADPTEAMLKDLTRAADGARQIVEGSGLAERELKTIIESPVGRRALDRLLITQENIKGEPRLQEALGVYISNDGRMTRFDIEPEDPMFSVSAMQRVMGLRKRIADFLNELEWINATAKITGSAAGNADIWDVTQRDQTQTWIVVPLGVLIVLIIALREPITCIALVASMILTYTFSLALTHIVFVSFLGAQGLDWKVPYFLFVLIVAVGVDYNIFLMSRVKEETKLHGLKNGVARAVGSTGGLISSAAAITVCSFSAFMFSPLSSLRQLGLALVIGITIDAILVRPVIVPCGYWLLHKWKGPLPNPGYIRLPRGNR